MALFIKVDGKNTLAVKGCTIKLKRKAEIRLLTPLLCTTTKLLVVCAHAWACDAAPPMDPLFRLRQHYPAPKHTSAHN